MPPMSKGKRPPFNKVMAHWRGLVGQRGLPSSLKWVFRENLCLERTGRGEEERKVSFQTQWPFVTEEDVRQVYVEFVSEKSPLVFAVLDHTDLYTLCTIAADKFHLDDDIYQEDWDLYFFLKKRQFIFEEIFDRREWRRRKRRESGNLNDFDYVPVLKYVKEQKSVFGRAISNLRLETVEGGTVIPVFVAVIYLMVGLFDRGMLGVLFTAFWLSIAFVCLWLGRMARDRWNKVALGVALEILGWVWLLLTGFVLTMYRPASV